MRTTAFPKAAQTTNATDFLLFYFSCFFKEEKEQPAQRTEVQRTQKTSIDIISKRLRSFTRRLHKTMENKVYKSNLMLKNVKVWFFINRKSRVRELFPKRGLTSGFWVNPSLCHQKGKGQRLGIEPFYAALCHSQTEVSEKRTTAGGRIADLPTRLQSWVIWPEPN